MPETKSEKFKRLRDQRLPKILHAIELLGNLSMVGYESSAAERQEIVTELTNAVNGVVERYGLSASDEWSPSLPTNTGELYIKGLPFSSTPDVELLQDSVEDVGAEAIPKGRTLKMQTLPQYEPVEGVLSPEGAALIKTGPKIGAAIEAIEDGDPEKAKHLLLEVMIS